MVDGGGNEMVLGRLCSQRRGSQENHGYTVAATVEQLKGLPPALVIVDENDILRDEGEEYAEN